MPFARENSSYVSIYFLLNLFIFIVLLYCIVLYCVAYMYAYGKAPEHLELELQTVVNRHMGTGN